MSPCPNCAPWGTTLCASCTVRAEVVPGEWRTLTREELGEIDWPRSSPAILTAVQSDAFADLHNRLLFEGGLFVNAVPDSIASQIVEGGFAFECIGVRGVPGNWRSYERLLDHWFAARKRLELFVGCALGHDGGWTKHMWLYDGRNIHEPMGPKYLTYCGFILPRHDALLFTTNELARLRRGPGDTGAGT